MRTHLGVIGLLAVFSVIYTWPVFQHPLSTIPGVPGNNILFYWDLWRTQEAVAACENPLFTKCVFYPHGGSMVFHTHSVLHAIFLLPLRPWVGFAAMFNVWVFASFLLGGWGAFLLGRFLLNNPWASLFLAFVFSFSPYRISHLGNHMMLFSTHWLPFYVLFLLKLRDGRWWHALLAGLFLSLQAWTDLHYTIHLAILTAFVVSWWTLRRFSLLRRPTDSAGMEANAGFSEESNPSGWVRRLGLLMVTAAICSLPLLIPAFQEIFRSQSDTAKTPHPMDIRMRSARLVHFVMPPARHPIWGEWGRESTELQLSIGLTVLALCWYAWRGRREGVGTTETVTFWTAASLLIVVLAMGPVLMISSKHTMSVNGQEYNLPLPHAILDRIPGVNMGRAPARFMGIGMLAISVLAACGLRRLMNSGRWKWAALAAAGVLIECAGRPFPVLWISIPPGLEQLAKQDGAVIDLPFGAGSALNQSGHMDPYSVLYQTVHGRPRVGGMISRCPDQHRLQLIAEPVLGSLLRIYDGETIDEADRARDRQWARETMHRYGIQHALLRPNQHGKAAHRYLCELFPHAVEHEFENGAVWIELNVSGTVTDQLVAAGQ